MKGLKDLELSVKKNFDKMKILQRELNENFKKTKEEKDFHEKQIKEIDKILYEHNHQMQVGKSQIAFLLIFSQLMSKIDKDRKTIKLINTEYSIAQTAELAKVAKDRYDLIRDATREGVSISDEALKLLKEDNLSFVIETESENLFKKSEKSEKFIELDKEIMSKKPKEERKEEDFEHEAY